MIYAIRAPFTQILFSNFTHLCHIKKLTEHSKTKFSTTKLQIQHLIMKISLCCSLSKTEHKLTLLISPSQLKYSSVEKMKTNCISNNTELTLILFCIL